MCIFGTPPDRLRWTSRTLELEVLLDDRPWFAGRATTLVIATGQFLRGLDVVPRGHPGDGKAEVQIYELARRERGPMRARLATGSHLPHPRIRQRTARTITLRSEPPAAWEVDGAPAPKPVSVTTITVVPGAYRLLL
jgi:diacylglycerol kinase family enzyme